MPDRRSAFSMYSDDLQIMRGVNEKLRAENERLWKFVKDFLAFCRGQDGAPMADELHDIACKIVGEKGGE